MEIVALHHSEIDQIKPLWGLFNQTHYENSNHWKDHFSNQTFDQWFEKLKEFEFSLMLAAKHDDEFIAFCFSVANQSSGEIVSIFVSKEFRNQGIGRELIMKSIAWMKSLNIPKIMVGVAEGNEAVFPFYEALGFKKRTTVFKLT
jgi:ribosomal protein S18 acetylase RimI-like enzyme